MILPKTVFILGAGSSVEFELPSGVGLASKVANKLAWSTDSLGNITSGDRPLLQMLRNTRPDRVSEYFKAGQIIAQALPLSKSIDDFLYIHETKPAVVELGKIAIALCILEAEAESSLHFDRVNIKNNLSTFHKLSDTWIYKLFTHIWTGVQSEDVNSIFKDIKIICFNYDRCVEHFFYNALQVAYDIAPTQAQEVMSTLDIVHPYGQVGGLPWQSNKGPSVEFGGEVAGPNVHAIADAIKTFTERAHDPAEVAEWRGRLVDASQIVALGFGFHAQNVELLDPGIPHPYGPWPQGFATTYGMSPQDTNVVQQRMHMLRGAPPPYSGEADLAGFKCADWVHRYGLLLSA